jgi:hypothetical protein
MLLRAIFIFEPDLPTQLISKRLSQAKTQAFLLAFVFLCGC